MGGLSKAKSCLQLGASPSADTAATEGTPVDEDPADLVPTSLFLPPADGEEEGGGGGGGGGKPPPERLYLPRSGTAPCSLDEYLRARVPRVASRAESLLASCRDGGDDELLLPELAEEGAAEGEDEGIGHGGDAVRAGNKAQFAPPSLDRRMSLRKGEEATATVTKTKRRRRSFLNVLQGEAAHATPSQADVVVSADATTCHVVALRSTSGGGSGAGSGSGSAALASNGADEPEEAGGGDGARRASPPSEPLVSVAHVDAPGAYDACLEAMVVEHIRHHGKAKDAARERGRLKELEKREDAGDEYGFFLDDEESEERRSSFPPDLGQSQSSFLPDLERSQSSFLPDLGHIGGGDGAPGSPAPAPARDEDRALDRDRDDEPIEMELHLMGGYLDEGGTSQDISTSLLATFSEVADKYRDRVRISLSSAAISCMNTEHGREEDDDGDGDGRRGGRRGRVPPKPRPRSRGMGIDTRTGRVFPVRSPLPPHLEGPAVDVRSARAFAQQDAGTPTHGVPRSKSLAVIHDASSPRGEIRIEPFRYVHGDPRLDVLLRVPDEVLLRVASTSPDCESPGFCRAFRRTVSFVNAVSPEETFGGGTMKPLVYARSARDLNEWERKE